MSKQSLRDEATRIRNSYSSVDVREYSESISLRAIELLKTYRSRTIHVYVSRRAEPRTIELIQWLLANDHMVYVPVLHGENMYCKTASDDTTQNIFKNPIPKDDYKACEHNADIDVAIVPTLCFDSAGNRLGYGKGYYDRFLAEHPTAVTIGLCYEANMVNAVPSEPHDVRLDMVITEHSIHGSFDKNRRQ